MRFSGQRDATQGMPSLVRRVRLLWLVGVCLLGGIGGTEAAAGAAGRAVPTSPATASPSKGPRRLLLRVPPMTVPARMLGLAGELSRALVSTLSDAGLDVRLVAHEARGEGERGTEVILGKLEEVGGERLRLTLTVRGVAVYSIGEQERLDDLVHAVGLQLTGKLAGMDLGEPVSEPRPTPLGEPAAGSKTGSARPTSKPPTGSGGGAPSAGGRPVTPTGSPPPLGSSPGRDAKDPPSVPIATGTPDMSPPTVLAPRPAPDASRPRPRVAVHLVGEPAGLPPQLEGTGALSQQAMMAFLSTQLRVTALPSRLVGLTGGLDALTQSLRQGARHTLMARFDALRESYSAVGGRVLLGRLYIVLLLDGRPLFERSVVLSPTPYYPAETLGQALTRLVHSALEPIGSDLQTRLHAPLAPVGPH